MAHIDSIDMAIKVLTGNQPFAMDSDYYYKKAVKISINALKKCEELGITIDELAEPEIIE